MTSREGLTPTPPLQHVSVHEEWWVPGSYSQRMTALLKLVQQQRYCLMSRSSNKKEKLQQNSADKVKVVGGEGRGGGGNSEYIGTKKSLRLDKSSTKEGNGPPDQTSCNLRPGPQLIGWQVGESRVYACLYVCVMFVSYMWGLGRREGAVLCRFTRGGSSCSLWFFPCSFDLQKTGQQCEIKTSSWNQKKTQTQTPHVRQGGR